MYLRDDPLLGTQLQNQSELRAPTLEKAAFYLDAALAARSSDQSDRRFSHLLYTLHVYQYSVDRTGRGGVAGGRSALRLVPFVAVYWLKSLLNDLIIGYSTKLSS